MRHDVLVVKMIGNCAQSSSEIPEGLMNNPVEFAWSNELKPLRNLRITCVYRRDSKPEFGEYEIVTTTVRLFVKKH